MSHDVAMPVQKQSVEVTRFPHPLPGAGTGKPLYLCIYDAIYSTIRKTDDPVPAGSSLPSESAFTPLLEGVEGNGEGGNVPPARRRGCAEISGKESGCRQYSSFENFTYQMLSHPVKTFCSHEFDRTEVEYKCVSNSDWLSERLDLAEGTVLVKGTIQYFILGKHRATTVFFTPFSLLEKESVKVSSNQALIDFIESSVYQRAEYGLSSVCLIDEMEDNELPRLALPLMLVEEFLYKEDTCFMFLRHYLDKDLFRIQTLRRRS